MISPRLRVGLVASITLLLGVGCGDDPAVTSDAGTVRDIPSVDRGPSVDTADVPAPVDLPVMDLPAADVPPVSTTDANDAASLPLRCEPFSIDPTRLRIATGTGGVLRARGGSGRGALFTTAPGSMLGGSSVSLGGSLLTGLQSARFQVVATDAVCNARATADIEVVGPFVVAPTEIRLAPSASVRFTVQGNLGTVRWESLSAPTGGDGRLDATAGSFTAGRVTGSYRLRARDPEGGGEVQVTVNVGVGEVFAPRYRVLLAPRGGEVPLPVAGGSGLIDASIVAGGPTGGRITGAPGYPRFNAVDAAPGTRTVQLTDRFTSERATLRVMVGDELAPVPIARGPQNLFGDVALGDLNGDGRIDLVFGQANRSATGNENGAVLVYYARANGSYASQPDVVIEGERDLDRYGTSVQVTDVDGDRIADLLVSSQFHDLGRDSRGSVSIYLGSSAGIVRPAERTFVGDIAGDRFGIAATVSDLDNDGVKDLVVVAPQATNPFATVACRNAGRVYVYRGVRNERGLFVTVPWTVVEVRDRLTDTDGPPECRTGSSVGSGLALVDVDNDGVRDLVLGAPGTQAGNFGSVMVYRGQRVMDTGGPMPSSPFEATPAWVMHLAMADRVGATRFGFALDVVPTPTTTLLVVRTPLFYNAAGLQRGGFWVITPGAFGARPASGQVRVVQSTVASARFTGADNDGTGRSAVVADLDGDNDVDYAIAGASDRTLDGVVHVFDGTALVGRGDLPARSTLRGERQEFLGAAMAAALPAGARGMSAAVAVWSAYRNTDEGYAVGTLRVLPAGAPRTVDDRWMAGTVLTLPVFPSFDRTGTNLAVVGPAGGVAVGTPGAHSGPVPMVGTTPARDPGFYRRVGAVDLFRDGQTTSASRIIYTRENIQIGLYVTALDFNGDRRLDLAVGDSTFSTGGNDMVTNRVIANPMNDPCLLRVGTTVTTASPGGRGIVRIFLQQPDGTLAERFLAIPAETVPMGGTLRRQGFGNSLGGRVDVNGDGFDDLLVGRLGQGATSNGAEVILGRAEDPMGRVLAVCNNAAAPLAAPFWPSRTEAPFYGRRVAAIGDIDGDTCGEVAVTVDQGGRSGVSIQFGFGPRCGRHATPFELHVAPDDRLLRDNIAGMPTTFANDLNDLAGSNGFGSVIAGGGDLTGDRVPDLVVRYTAFQMGTLVGPAAEVISGAYLARACPDRDCPEGIADNVYADGAYAVVGVRPLTAPNRLTVLSPTFTSVRFAESLHVTDLDGDGAMDLVVGSPDDSVLGEFSGAIMAWRAGPSQTTWSGRPWLVGAGDAAEQSLFGTSISSAPISGGGTWLAVGAPNSGHRGALTGAAYRWRIDR